MPQSARNPVKAVQTALQIVDFLQEESPVGVTEISNAVGVTKGTVHCHLATLRQQGYVVKEKEKYKLGLRFVDVGQRVRDQNPIYHLAKDEVNNLADSTGEVALFTVEEEYKGICLHTARGEQAVRTELRVGHRNDLYHTAVGKAILAHKPVDEVDEFLDTVDFEQITDRTITDKERLLDELQEVRQNGLAYNHGETIPGLVGVGAPIRSQSGDVYGAISVIGPTSRMDDEHIETVASELRHAVNVIEINATSL
ncbi:IclR family transcriptional regulator [Haloprofundus salinisoli]|uniref:IclR family transcriptional regulator n=1 Tax=Haloprofundus salinisoli TaxID=2876193 RepID=UPI001CCE1D80|nr:IclR family transcriptional regulator [Haloprofundus salinisoli]